MNAHRLTLDILKLIIEADNEAEALHSLNMEALKLHRLVIGLDQGSGVLDDWKYLGGPSVNVENPHDELR